MAAETVESVPDPREPMPVELRTRPWHQLSGRLTARLDELADGEVWTMDAQRILCA